MTLQEAKERRDKHISIIGRKSPTVDLNIVDVIAEPVGIGDSFRLEYLKLMMAYHRVSNDELLKQFNCEKYQVIAVLDYYDDYTNLVFDDIKFYTVLIN